MKLAKHHVPGEFVGKELASEHFFVFSSGMESEDFVEFFSGIGFTKNELVFGKTGFHKLKKDQPERNFLKEMVEGRFIVGEYVDGDFLIKTDPAGQFIVYMWKEGDKWALSNSLFVLAREIEALGSVPRLYSPALAVFSAAKNDRDHGQIISEKTTIENAICVPAGAVVKIVFRDKKPFLEGIHTRELAPVNKSRDEYLENILSFISKWRARMLALSAAGVNMRINLSGGKDSRTVLALLNSAVGKNITASTKSNGSIDERVATEIIKNHARADGRESDRPEQPLSNSENFALNLMSGAGVKRFGYRSYSSRYPRGIIWTGGAGFDSAVFRSPLLRRLENAEKTSLIQNEKIRKDVLHEYRAGMRSFPCELRDNDAIFYHYAGYRARYHYGAKSLIGSSQALMPLFSGEIARVFLASPEFSYIRRSGINYDVVSICAPELLKYPFTGDHEKPSLLTRGLTIHDVPEGNAFTFYGRADENAAVVGARQVFGPDGLSILKRTLPEALRRFGGHFERHVLDEAKREVHEVGRLGACRNAALLCSLCFLFPEANNSLH